METPRAEGPGAWEPRTPASEVPGLPSLARQWGGVGGVGWGHGWDSLGGQLTSAASRLGSCRRSSSGTRLFSTSFRRGPRSPRRRPRRPSRTSVPRSPIAEARTESRACVGGRGQGAPGGEGLRKDAAWGCDLEAQSRAWGSLGAGPVLGRFGRGSLEGWGIAHIIQQRRQARPQLGAQEPHGCPWPQQDPPQRAQRSTHEPRVGLAQCAQERGQQRTHVPRLWGQGSWAGVVGGRSQTPPAPPGAAPGAAAHLPLVEREVAEAQQAQPAHGGLGVALPGVQPLQDALLPQEPRGGPALQQLSGGHGLSTLPSQRRQCCLGRGPQPPLTPLPGAGSPQ